MVVPVFIRVGKHTVNLEQVAEILCEPAPFGVQGEMALAAFVRLACGREIVVTGSEAVQMQRLADQLAVDHDDLRPNEVYADQPTDAELESVGDSSPWDDDTPL